VERVVRLSAVGAAHDAPTRSGRLHALADHELQQSGLSWTILRPHWFMQNLLGAAAPITAHGAVHLNLGQGRIGMIDVRDVAAVAAGVLTSPPEDHHARIYTPTGPRAITLDEAVRELSRAAGRDIDYVAPEDGA